MTSKRLHQNLSSPTRPLFNTLHQKSSSEQRPQNRPPRNPPNQAQTVQTPHIKALAPRMNSSTCVTRVGHGPTHAHMALHCRIPAVPCSVSYFHVVPSSGFLLRVNPSTLFQLVHRTDKGRVESGGPAWGECSADWGFSGSAVLRCMNEEGEKAGEA